MGKLPIHQDTIDEVNQRVDIVDVVSEYVVLRKSGANLRGPCPFHQGSNPTAFQVNPSRQMYHCFSCGAAGGAIKFLMELGKQSFSDVVIELANRHHIPIKTLEPAKQQEFQRQQTEKEQLHEVMALAASFYHHALYTSQGKSALEYIRQKRGLTEETIQKFQFGYAPAGWNKLYNYLVEERRLPVVLVEAAGLIVTNKTGAGYYDRFRDRVMIPIRDDKGRVIAFGGRALDGGEPKYLNSPETPLFHKGTILFAMDRAKDTIAKLDRAIVVEGYLDAIALHQAGIKEAVATMGVALSLPQLNQLVRYTESKQIILNFDGDQAGINAADKAIENFKEVIFNGTVQLRVLTMPEGKDADEFLKHHDAAAYQQLVADAPLFLDWRIQQLLANHNLNQADHFQRCSQGITNLLSNLPDNSFLRTHYLHTAAQQLSQGNAYLALRIEQDLRKQLRHQRWYGHQNITAPKNSTSALQLAEERLLQVFLQFPAHRQFVFDELEGADLSFSLSNHLQLWHMILDLIDNNKLDLANPVYPDNLLKQLQLSCIEDPEISNQLHYFLREDDNSRVALLRPQMVVKAAIVKIQAIHCEKRMKHWLAKFEKTDVKLDCEIRRYYYEQFQREKTLQQMLSKQIEVNYTDLIEQGLTEPIYFDESEVVNGNINPDLNSHVNAAMDDEIEF